MKHDLSKAKRGISALFHMKFKPAKDTGIASLTGFAVILTSLALRLFSEDSMISEIGFFVLKDIMMMAGIGFAFPLYYILAIKGEPLRTLGITKDKLGLSLGLNVILAVFLLFLFMEQSAMMGKEIFFDSAIIIPVIYLFVCGIFETIFFYGFLRHQFEQSFGIIPGIVLASLFYSFHHVGFQPEFLKLMFVGIMYATVFRITGNAFIIFPFFWGVGAIWDVLFSFGAQEQLQGIWTLTKAMMILTFMVVFSMNLKKS